MPFRRGQRASLEGLLDRADVVLPALALGRDLTKLLICSTPKLVPFLASWNGPSNIGIASRWSHLINKCGARAFAQVTYEATVSPSGETN